MNCKICNKGMIEFDTNCGYDCSGNNDHYYLLRLDNDYNKYYEVFSIYSDVHYNLRIDYRTNSSEIEKTKNYKRLAISKFNTVISLKSFDIDYILSKIHKMLLLI